MLERNPKARLFEETNDDFFAAHDLKRLFGRPVDFAFLDGMHEFPFLLRDFINTERNCRAGSIIVLHDCLPGDAHMERLLEVADPVSSTAWVETLQPFDFWARATLKFSARFSTTPTAPTGAPAY